jgi:hypothetical protein
MIHSLDLKLKNWVKYNNGYFQIAALTEDFPYLNNDEFGHGIVSYDNIFGIELTEGILVKLGWKKETWDDAVWYEKTYPVIGQLCTSPKWDYIFDINTDTLRITYLHELQNLIYILCKKELKISL